MKVVLDHSTEYRSVQTVRWAIGPKHGIGIDLLR